MARFKSFGAVLLFSVVSIAGSISPLPAIDIKIVHIAKDSFWGTLRFIDNDFYVEDGLDYPREITIRRRSDPERVFLRMTQPKNEKGFYGEICARATQKKRLYIVKQGVNEGQFIFDPTSREVIALTDDSPYLDDSILVGGRSFKRWPLNHDFYYVKYRADSDKYKYGEIVNVQKGFYHEDFGKSFTGTYPLVTQWFNDWYVSKDAFNIGYDDRFGMWFEVKWDASEFYVAQRQDNGEWTGKKVVPKDRKNRMTAKNVPPSLDENWKFLTPRTVIGPYSPVANEYPYSEFLSLEILDMKGNVYPTGNSDIESFDVSPNGRYVIVQGMHKQYLAKEGYSPSYIYIYEITYSGTIIDSRVRMRDQPGVNGNILKVLDKQQTCVVLEHSEFMETINDAKDCWYKIRLPDGKEGWIFGAFLEFQ